MDLKALINDNIGKRMAAMAWAVYKISETEDMKRCVIIAGLVMVYMVLQTVGDYFKRAK